MSVALHLVAGRFQRLGVDFPEDFLFGEVLRADRQADLAVSGLETIAPPPPSPPLRCCLSLLRAACGDSEAEEEREQHRYRGAAHPWSLVLTGDSSLVDCNAVDSGTRSGGA